ncbi:MAG TPA: electron transfer flavoprotein subunit beta/FixA family protein [Desulfobacteraceae bacterium]|nr:electron transfer flavoprotein subunit beta/FixA family protein [Desulfobacteraceae bacterium]
MNILCAVKFVPDVDSVAIDVENLAGTSSRRILNPDDACALAFALQVKAGHPGCNIEVVSLGPLSVRPHMEDLLRLAVDRGTLICDPLPDGCSGVTSRVLATYIAQRPYDCILTGSHSLDGGSARVPVEIAEILGLDQMLGIIGIDPDQFAPQRFNSGPAVVEVAQEGGIATYEMAMPCVFSLTRDSGYKLPYVKLTDMRRDVSDGLTVIDCKTLGLSDGDLKGAPLYTEAVTWYPQTFAEKEKKIVQTDEAGIDYVFDVLKAEGFLSR